MERKPFRKIKLESLEKDLTRRQFLGWLGAAAAGGLLGYLSVPFLSSLKSKQSPEVTLFIPPTLTPTKIPEEPTPTPSPTASPEPQESLFPTTIPEKESAQPFPITQEVLVSEIVLSLWEEKTYRAINELRNEKNLPPLELSKPLIKVARERGDEMASQNHFSHTNKEGQKVFDLLEQKGIFCTDKNEPGKYGCGEILFRTNYDESHIDEAIEVVMDEFLNSPDHRPILLNDRYRFIGIGVAVSENNLKYGTIVLTFPVK